MYDKGMDEYRYPASTTKIMTLLVAIENSSPKDIVTFTETGIRDVTWDSSNINAQLGETMTMKDCWMAIRKKQKRKYHPGKRCFITTKCQAVAAKNKRITAKQAGTARKRK